MTIARQEAEDLAREYLARIRGDASATILLEDQTIDDPLGWVFFYQSREFVETGAMAAMLARSAPLLVLCSNSEIIPLGTAHPVDHYLEAIREKVGRSPPSED